MSDIRRTLIMQQDGGHMSGDPFETVVNAINQLSGEKSFLYKFDNSPYVYVLVFDQWSSTVHTLHVFDLNGNDLDSIELSSKYHNGVVKDNYICLYGGNSNYSVPLHILYFDGNSISLLKTRTNSYNWPGVDCWFAYRDASSNLHFCSKYIKARTAIWDYNLGTDSISGVESSLDKWVSWYHYDGTYFRGLIWSSTSGQLQQVSYLKRTSTTNNYNSSTFSPVLNNNYIAWYYPLFFYNGSYSNLKYEAYAMESYPGTLHNVLGLNKQEPTSLTFGDISLLSDSNQDYNVRAYGGLSYVDNAVFHMYAYNKTSGKVVKYK
jgi:hypothetical protein